MNKLNIVGKIDDKIQSLSKGNAQKIQFIKKRPAMPVF